MKNININGLPGDIIVNQTSVSLANLQKRIRITEENGARTIQQISLAVLISATQSKDKKVVEKIDPELTFSFKEKYEIAIRLTETFSGVFNDLDSFVLEPAKKMKSEGLCKDVFEHIQLCLYNDIVLPEKKEKERFVIKILIRRVRSEQEQAGEWIVQTILPLELDENV